MEDLIKYLTFILLIVCMFSFKVVAFIICPSFNCCNPRCQSWIICAAQIAVCCPFSRVSCACIRAITTETNISLSEKHIHHEIANVFFCSYLMSVAHNQPCLYIYERSLSIVCLPALHCHSISYWIAVAAPDHKLKN